MTDYLAPYLLDREQKLPSGSFLLPICTTPERLQEMLDALIEGGIVTGRGVTNDHNIDFFRALENLWELPTGTDCENVNFCDLMIDCLNEATNGQNDSLAVAVASASGVGAANNGGSIVYGGIGGFNPSVIQGEILDPSLCLEGNLFAAARQIVRVLHEANLSLLATIEGYTNFSEGISKVISAIPLLGLLPFDELIDFIDIGIENIRDFYIANATPQRLDEYACNLYCNELDDCSITFDDIIQLFQNAFGITDAATLALVSYINTHFKAPIAPVDSVAALFALNTAILARGGSFSGYTADGFKKAVAAAQNDFDNDWQVLCDQCAPVFTSWRVTYDLTIGDGGWLVDVWGEGRTASGFGSEPNACYELSYIRRDWGSEYQITSVTGTYAAFNTFGFFCGGNAGALAIASYDQALVASTLFSEGAEGKHDDSPITWVGSESARAVRLVGNPQPFNNGQWFWTNVVIEGVGSTPPEVNNPSMGVVVEQFV